MVFTKRHDGIERAAQVTHPCLSKKRGI